MSFFRPVLASSLIILALAGCEKTHTPTPKMEASAVQQNSPETRVPATNGQPGLQGQAPTPR
ncbi:hypothetical protein [uncultured Oxalicibacterium sp.]|uniref:hypothetical protein n=1 Tax=uncultured Oxalicibacterium sp. TaxID=1168540 RepID=UPI0025DE1F30|nr:hypothetical protein [uncultured Oxalicibacterium sp.]